MKATLPSFRLNHRLGNLRRAYPVLPMHPSSQTTHRASLGLRRQLPGLRLQLTWSKVANPKSKASRPLVKSSGALLRPGLLDHTNQRASRAPKRTPASAEMKRHNLRLTRAGIESRFSPKGPSGLPHPPPLFHRPAPLTLSLVSGRQNLGLRCHQPRSMAPPVTLVHGKAAQRASARHGQATRPETCTG